MPRLPMRKARVDELLDTINLYTNVNRNSFDARLADLKKLREKLLQQENELYNLFNVKNIEELNEKIKKYQGLRRLGGAQLSHELDKRLIDDSGSTQEMVLEQIINSPEFSDVLSKRSVTDMMQIYTNEFAIDLANALNSTRNSHFRVTAKANKKNVNRKVGLERILENVMIDGGQYVVKKIEKNKRVSRDFIRDVQTAFSQTSVSTNDSGGTARVSILSQNRENYGGWRYSWKNIKEDEVLIQKIRQSILDLCLQIMNGSEEEVRAFKNAYMKVPSQMLLASTVAGVQGVIGEIALGAYLQLLTGGEESGFQTGIIRNMLKKNKDQISIDYILSGCGFQVKNYNEFSYNIPNSVVLDRTAKLYHWFDMLDLSNALQETLKMFYGIRWFNIKYHEDYADTEARIMDIEYNLREFYAQYPDKILRLAEDIEGIDAFETNELSGNFYNTFFFVSGQKFIPSSTILFRIIHFFEKIKNGSTSAFDIDVFNTSSYSGTNILDYRGKDKKGNWEYNIAPSYDAVAGQVNLTLKYRIYLDDILMDLY